MSDRLQRIQTRYQNSETANRYDSSRYHDFQGRWNNRTVWSVLKKALKHVPAKGRIIDLPCGTGRFSWHLAGEGFQVIASDISTEMLAVAEKAEPYPDCPKPVFQKGDLFNLPFRDDEFDAVFCIRFMNLVEKKVRVAAVKEMARLAPILIISYYHKYTLKYFSRWLRYRLGLRKAPHPRLTKKAFLDEIKETGLYLRQLLPVTPLLSEEWIAILERPNSDVQK
ncbi:MAG: class I SAM-dependent methyltransferase [Verrucomicrobiota bacterium]